MTILLKGPYSRKDYNNIQDNLEEQTNDLNTHIERINNNVIMITLMVGALYCLGTIAYMWTHKYEPIDTILPFIIGGAVSILIIALIASYFSVKPYNKQKESLYEESKRVEKHYRDNMVEVPLSEYMDHINVKGDKVTFPPLDEIDERYLYKEWSYNIASENHNTRQIMRIYENFYENDRLYTAYTWMSITREECRMLQTKGRRW